MADEFELEKWRETFSLFDKKGNGHIECSAIGEVMRVLGQNPTQAEVKRIINEIDPTGEKEVSFEEFVPLMNLLRMKSCPKDEYASFCEGFKVFDRENNGMVSLGEVRSILMSMGEMLTTAEADVLFEGMGDNNGQINYEEFIRAIMDG